MVYQGIPQAWRQPFCSKNSHCIKSMTSLLHQKNIELYCFCNCAVYLPINVAFKIRSQRVDYVNQYLSEIYVLNVKLNEILNKIQKIQNVDKTISNNSNLIFVT